MYQMVLVASTILLASVAFSIASLASYWQYQATHHKQGQVTISKDIIVHSSESPEETPPVEACTNYQVPPSQPRKITIQRVGIEACIQRVGIDQYNAIAVPNNVHLVGWYVDSAVPGEDGVSVIDGHATGRYGLAAFGGLQNSKPNDKIVIEFGDYSIKIFQVVDVHSYDINHVMDMLFQSIPESDINNSSLQQETSETAANNQLALITCGGSYDANSHSYNERIIVRAELQPSQ